MPESRARREQLETIFDLELSHRVQRLNSLIASYESETASGAAAAIGRELHNLKAAARAAEAPAIERMAHAAETAALAIGDAKPTVAWCTALRRALEKLPALRDDRDADVSLVVGPLAAGTRINSLTPARPVARERTEPGSVRVALAKLDTLLTESGELAVTQLRIGQRLSELRDVQHQLERLNRDRRRRSDQELQTILKRVRKLVGDLGQNTSELATVAVAIGQEVIAIRLLPAGTIFSPLERLVRDLCRQTGKDVRLELEGADIELDRRILDELRDPLLHMVRNTIDHGIESPEERIRAGKPSQGCLRLSAAQRGDRIRIQVTDDGRGLDVEAIRATAIRRNLLTPDRAEQLDSASLMELIFHTGFSTRESVSELSGRGIGLDVVRDRVAHLGGDIGVRSTSGAGTTFTITTPLTLATTRVLLVEDLGHTYAVPSSSIERTGRVRANELHRLEGRVGLKIDGRVVPVVELSNLLQVQRAVSESTEWRPFFVLAQGDRSVAVLTDRLVDETELVVKALGAPLVRVRHVSGAAVLGTGNVVVILNASDLFKSALGTVEIAPRAGTVPAEIPKASRRTPSNCRILVVDDSVMTRTLERTILESAGYAVIVAADGRQALERLEQDEIDAIVSDVEMPRMTGLELTAAVRHDERWRHLPVVLVTSLDAPDHVERGAAAGADAYIVKGRFDQNELLETVGRLL